MAPKTPPERLPYATALASGQGAMLVAVQIVHQTTTDNKQDASGPHVYQNDLPGKVTKLVGELSRDGLDAIAKVVNHVGPQPAQGIAVIAPEVPDRSRPTATIFAINAWQPGRPVQMHPDLLHA
jgi:hypothetical protein